MAISINCTVTCDACGRVVAAMMRIQHHYSDGCYTILANHGVTVVDAEGMVMDGSHARCADQQLCATRQARREVKYPDMSDGPPVTSKNEATM